MTYPCDYCDATPAKRTKTLHGRPVLCAECAAEETAELMEHRAEVNALCAEHPQHAPAIRFFHGA